MAIVAGVDFGTLSVRVSIVDQRDGAASGRGRPSTRCTGRRGSRPRHAEPSTTTWRRWCAATRARARERPASRGDQVEAIALDTTGSSVVPVGEGLQPLDDYYLWCDHRAWREAALDHEDGARAGPRGDPLVRRRLLVRVGLLEAAALAAPQPRQARPVRDRPRALRHGGGHAVRHHRPRRGAAQRLRDGPQVDVERLAGRPAAGGLPRRGGPAARRACGTSWPAATHLRPDRRAPRPRVGGAARPAGRHPDPGRRLRRALGRDRRRRPPGRRRQRDRHLHLHHGVSEQDGAASPACAAWCPAPSTRR